MKKQLGLSVAAAGLSLVAFAAPAFAATIGSQMDIGTRGGDVTTLQQTFAGDASIYPEGLVTGYFGSLSSAAVKRFQAAQGIVSSGSAATTGYGRVGPSTIAKFNAVYGSGTVSVGAPIFQSVTIAPNNGGTSILWTTNQPATGVVYYSTSPLVVSEAAGPGQAPTVGGTNVMTMNTTSGTSNSAALTNLNHNTTYYYMIKSTSSAGGISVTWPSSFTNN